MASTNANYPGVIERRTWGKTGLDIPAITFGAAGFGGVFKPVDHDQAMALIARSDERGINQTTRLLLERSAWVYGIG